MDLSPKINFKLWLQTEIFVQILQSHGIMLNTMLTVLRVEHGESSRQLQHLRLRNNKFALMSRAQDLASLLTILINGSLKFIVQNIFRLFMNNSDVLTEKTEKSITALTKSIDISLQLFLHVIQENHSIHLHYKQKWSLERQDLYIQWSFDTETAELMITTGLTIKLAIALKAAGFSENKI